MKPPRSHIATPTLLIFGSLLFGGCYTQFTLADRDPADEPEAQPVYIDQPPIVVIEYIPQPIFIPSPFLPAVPVITRPVTGSGGTATPPKRDFGNQRTPAPPSRVGTTPPRSGRITAPEPAPAVPAPSVVAPAPAPAAPPPAPAAPARSSETRPAGGSGGRR